MNAERRKRKGAASSLCSLCPDEVECTSGFLNMEEDSSVILDESQASLMWRAHPFRRAVDESGGKISQEDSIVDKMFPPGGQPHAQCRLRGHAHLSPLLAVSPPETSSFYDPHTWLKTYQKLYSDSLPPSACIALSHRKRSTLNTGSAVRAACCVRVLPELDAIKAALKKPVSDRCRDWYDMWESASAYGVESPNGLGTRRRGSLLDEGDMVHVPTPHIWAALSRPEGHVIDVYEAFSGAHVLRISEPKAQLAVTSLLHAPFRGLIDRQLRMISIQNPKDLLRLRSQQLIETDYVWVGFTDGSVRLFPANPNRIRNTDRSEQMVKGELEDLVFELPKYHNASIIGIARSPCHGDDKGMDFSTVNRLSAAIQYMTAASSKGSESKREHLSLMCTASIDSSIVVWDVGKIYQALEAMRIQKKTNTLYGRNAHDARKSDAKELHPSAIDNAAYSDLVSGDIVTIECYTASTGSHKKTFCVRSMCTMVKVRPVLRLKGGVTALKSIQWVSTLVTTQGYHTQRSVADATRNAEEQSAPKFVRERRDIQVLTRFQRREEHRHVLQLDENEMRQVEEELKGLMPSLSEEPLQSLRVNLIIAGDSVGTIHLWNLDEELRQKQIQDPFDCGVGFEKPDLKSECVGSAIGTIPGGGSESFLCVRSDSPGRTSLGSHEICYSTASPSIHMSALAGPSRTSALKKMVGKAPKVTTRKASSTVTVALLGGPSKGLVQSAIKKKTATPTHAKEAKRSLLNEPKGVLLTARTPNKLEKRTSLSVDASRPRPSGHLNKDARRKGGIESSVSTPPAAELLQGRLSKLQKLANMTKDAHMPLRVIKAIMHSANVDPIASSPLPSEEVPNLRTKRRSNAVSIIATPLRPAETTCPKGSLKQTESKKDRKNATSLPLSRQKRPASQTTGKTTLARAGSQTRPRPNLEMSQSTGKTSSRAVARNDILSRASKFRIEFTGGVAITGIAVDVPDTLQVTLRQCPNAKERPFSLLEEPSPEEVERRNLENSFELLTESKALFFFFQQLELYVAAEGVALNLECTPSWHEDCDGYAYFKALKDLDQRHAKSSLFLSSQVEQGSVVGEVEFPCFAVQLRKRILEVHSQPVTQLFFDKACGLIWVARNDGFLSLFSKYTKQIVTRIAHPCADVALPPLPHAEWKKQQETYLREITLGRAPSHLEWHQKTRGYEPAHFNVFLPFSKRSQTTLILVSGREQMQTETPTLQHLSSFSSRSEHYPDTVGLSKSEGVTDPSTTSFTGLAFMRVQKIDGRSDMDIHACYREKYLNDLAARLLYCRDKADRVRRAQKSKYQLQCDLITTRVRYLMQELSYCTSFLDLSRLYDTWKKYTQNYRHEHILRRERVLRGLQLAPLVDVAMRATSMRHRGRYFYLWSRWCTTQIVCRREHVLKKIFTHLILPSRHLPTKNMMDWLWTQRTRVQIYKYWKAVAQRRCVGNGRSHSSSRASMGSTSVMTTPTPFAKSTFHNYNASLNVSPLVRTETCTYLGGVEPSTVGCTDKNLEYDLSNAKLHHNNTSLLSKQQKLTTAQDYYAKPAISISVAHLGKENIPPGEVVDETQSEESLLVSTFIEMMGLLFNARHTLMQFKDNSTTSPSVFDESWLSLIESSEGGAEVKDEIGRRLAVFSYGLLPLLQGLLFTASDVLLNLNDSSVAEGVISLMGGIQLCIDYVTADAEDSLTSLLAPENATKSGISRSLFIPDNLNVESFLNSAMEPTAYNRLEVAFGFEKIQPHRIDAPNKVQRPEMKKHTSYVDKRSKNTANPYLMSPSTFFVNTMRFFVLKAIRDPESLDALREVTHEKESLESFISFLQDENAVERRCPLWA